ncbi:phosphatidylinositol-3,5-bisphosphate 3-phosphatase MTMR6-like isoform X1 [Branchiostoma floridae x Branchiostoma japonicum]
MEHIRTPKKSNNKGAQKPHAPPDFFMPVQVENVRLQDRFNTRKPAIGTLYLTATHLIFVDPNSKRETWVLHMHIDSVEKLPLSTVGSPLLIRCKTFQTVTFVIAKERECHDIFESLIMLSRPATITELYAFQYNPQATLLDHEEGWNYFSLEAEFSRQGLPNNRWVHSPINKDYQICDTYPRTLFVPTGATTPILLGSSKFRSRGRLPVLSYYHKDNHATICRCSQPLSGFSARCLEDEQMLQAIMRANPNCNFMYVVDTRPKINAMVNKAAGKGYESTDFYSNIRFQFLGIENIHVMRNSLDKLIEVCDLKNPSVGDFLSGLENSSWLKHIKAIMDTSLFIAKAVLDEHASVLVHCSDGWDRTAQTCSLAGVFLDPYYRTLQGFQALIEKEWLDFGHKFTDRLGLTAVEEKEVSPVFTQFVECVWQLTQQFPCAFQFNESFLLTLHDHAYSCQFGTFLGNCQREREELSLSTKTYSLWGYMRKNMSDYVNPLYSREHPVTQGILLPNTAPQNFKFWRGMYNRYENGVHPRESVTDTVSAMKDHSASLEDHVRLLEKRIAGVKKLLGKDAVLSPDLQAKGDSNPETVVNNAVPTKDSPSEDNGANAVSDASSESGIEDVQSPVNGDSASAEENEEKNDKEDNLDSTNDLVEEAEAGAGQDVPETKVENSPSAGAGDSMDVSLNRLSLEMDSVALEWKAFRNIRQCSCETPLDAFNKKYHCWRCGDIFCTRCIDKQTPIPGHYSQRPVPVCRTCYKHLKLESTLS